MRGAGGLRQDVNLPVLIRTFGMTMFGYVVSQLIVFSEEGIRLLSMPQWGEEEWAIAILDIYLHGVTGLKSRGSCLEQVR